MKWLCGTIVALLLATGARADDTASFLARIFPDRATHLGDIGRGVAVIFSPDLSVEGNCRFYSALGFACFDDTDWTRVLDGIHRWNATHPASRIETVVLETHGTNGHGLKLQRSNAANAERSYISVGALQERLEPEGVRMVVLSACNSGRLLRPAIYRNLDPNPGDRLFLPATCGIIGASAAWDANRTRVELVAPATSHVEMTVVGKVSELKPVTRKALAAAAKAAGVKAPREFAVSDLMMQMMTRDRALRLKHAERVDDLSRVRSDAAASERLFTALLRRLDRMAM